MKSKKVFNVEVTEIHQIKDTVEAKNKEEALIKAKTKYKNHEYLFDTKCLVAAEFEIREK